MSAFQLSSQTINVITQAALKHLDRVQDDNDPQFEELFKTRTPLEALDASVISTTSFGQLLVRENEKSVCYRYKEPSEEIWKSYSYRKPPIIIKFSDFEQERQAQSADPLLVIKQIHCLIYQSCEHPEWEESRANELLTMLVSCLTREIVGYDKMPWGL